MFKDKIPKKQDAKVEPNKLRDEEEKKIKERRKEFDSLMEYSIEDAIQSKKEVR